MHKDRKHASWLSRWMHARPASMRDDPADYGTAFGLELSIGNDEPDLPATTPPPRTAAGWWARWRQRAA
jgi:hypothetical protein